MPEIGEIKRANEIGRPYKNRHLKFIWCACIDCGKERWVDIIGGKPNSKRCRDCALIARRSRGAVRGKPALVRIGFALRCALNFLSI